jgi:hypothetical protein
VRRKRRAYCFNKATEQSSVKSRGALNLERLVSVEFPRPEVVNGGGGPSGEKVKCRYLI